MMPRATTDKHKPQPAASEVSKTRETVLQTAAIDHKAVSPVVMQAEQRPATPVQRTRKRVVRRPKYHETTKFLERESFKGLAPTDGLPPHGPNTGTLLGESYRVASTVFQAAQRASQETRPVSWGYGDTDGALGHHNTRRVGEMKRLAIFRRTIVRAVSAGNRLSLFLTDDKRIFQSGRLFMKQDGCKMWKPVEIAMESVQVPSAGATVVAVEAGHLAAYAVDDQGRVYSWGSQIFGQLGHGEELELESSLGSEDSNDGESETKATRVEGEDPQGEENSNSEEEENKEPQPKVVIVDKMPRLVESLAGHSIFKISAGNHFVVAISSTGAAFSWGRGCSGQLGNGGATDTSTPARIESLEDYVAVDITAGASHVLGVFVQKDDRAQSNQHEPSSPQQHKETAATERTVVVAWGRGKHGCLGLGGSRNELLPCENAFFRGLGAAKVAAGADHSLVLCCVGAHTFLYAFGGNQLGQLGVASSADHVDMPSFVDEFVNVHVADIGAGASYSAALTGDGEVFTWGDARYGKTCRADGRTTFVPWKVDLPRTVPSSSFVTQLSIGVHHSLAQLRINGQVDRWRKFPLAGIVCAVRHEEPSSKVSVCYCKSSQTTTRSVLGIFVRFGRSLQRICVCSEGGAGLGVSCLFATRLPFAIPEEDETQTRRTA
ncbi:hypothetical protein PR002_g16721 [Phytophthora rubi]|uniref:Uncharacterized protein n=1 Tax=Phytophthora rubi TaxID=129364 RepID=A0A6A3KKP1_9STRA|nr:hypothetical protein PR002_g16721 [Phytophthora rubi]